MIIGINKWAIVATVLVAVCSGIGVMIGTWTEAPYECRDFVELSKSEGRVTCYPHSKLTVEPPGDKSPVAWVIKCTCPADGGAR